MWSATSRLSSKCASIQFCSNFSSWRISTEQPWSHHSNQWDSSVLRFPLNVLRTLLTVFLQPSNSPLFWATQICCWLKWSQTSPASFPLCHGNSKFTLSFPRGTTMHTPNSVLLLPSTVNPALIRKTFAEDVLSTMPGPPHYHIMQNSALLSSSHLIISLFNSY